MPKVDGWEVMAKLHETGEVNKMPVVVLTASKDHPDSGKCLEMGARALIAKPVSIDGFVTCMEEIKMYWIIEKDPDEQY
ncbi:MAG: response regulator [Sphingobacteriales bacterium JAD_PAG50586_3]|nr:MAG: response regulator [Sphingobacteriales bacterium JAD_PAG50586_3]